MTRDRLAAVRASGGGLEGWDPGADGVLAAFGSRDVLQQLLGGAVVPISLTAIDVGSPEVELTVGLGGASLSSSAGEPPRSGAGGQLRAYPIDRGCPLDAAGDRCFWHGWHAGRIAELGQQDGPPYDCASGPT